LWSTYRLKPVFFISGVTYHGSETDTSTIRYGGGAVEKTSSQSEYRTRAN
jgi:hypothetical protein